MIDAITLIESGTLEMYVLGLATPEETLHVEQMATNNEAVRLEINAISIALEKYTFDTAIEPEPTLGPFIMATINYMERLKGGELPSLPPMLHSASKVADYAQWLNREDMKAEPDDELRAHIIGYTPDITTAIVWLKTGAPPETHTKEFEKFLIVEGTCDITIGNDIHQLSPGDVLSIPLFISHNVKVTSLCACKMILQRIAA